MRFALPRLVLSLAAVGTLSACLQGIGDRCQLDSDCAGSPDTAFCAVPNGNRAAGGTCQMKGGVTADMSIVVVPAEMGIPDLAPPPDLFTPEAGTDGATGDR
jgi:hypothetical protein